MKIYSETIESNTIEQDRNEKDIELSEIVYGEEGPTVPEAQLQAALELIAELAFRRYKRLKSLEPNISLAEV